MEVNTLENTDPALLMSQTCGENPNLAGCPNAPALPDSSSGSTDPRGVQGGDDKENGFDFKTFYEENKNAVIGGGILLVIVLILALAK